MVPFSTACTVFDCAMLADEAAALAWPVRGMKDLHGRLGARPIE